MIQNHRFATGIIPYLKYISFEDISPTSDNYFRIIDLPDRLYAGKSSFRLKANLDTLVEGSTIYIDIIDSNGNTIYHEIAPWVGNDKSRLIIIHVYENSSPGEATLYISGRLKYDTKNKKIISYDNDPNSFDFLHRPNLVWKKKLSVVPDKVNEDEIIYTEAPIVSCHERNEYFSSAPVSERKKTINPTGSISLKSIPIPEQYSNTSRFSTTSTEIGRDYQMDPTGSSQFINSETIKLPKFSDLNILRSEGFEFSSDMAGGRILIKPPGATEYSASIIKVIDKNTLQVNSPYYSSASSFIGATDITMSYISKDVTLQSFETESFVQIDFKNLEPIAGNVDKIRVSYKPFGTFGEFISIGEFPLKVQNYLIDSSSLVADKTTIIETPIGDLDLYQDYADYWDLIPITSSIYCSFNQPNQFDKGCKLFYSSSTAITSSDYLMEMKLKDDYLINCVENTEYRLELSSKYIDQQYTNINNSSKNFQIDLYISGSPIICDEIKFSKLDNFEYKEEFGTYIGSINTKYGSTQLNSKFYFKTVNNGTICPVLVPRTGTGWEIKELYLSPRNEIGYSPNQAKLLVPINSLKTDVELVLQLDYLNVLGVKSDKSTILYGLNFKGSGFPKDRLLKGTEIVSSSGQFKNLLDQFTSSLFPSGGDYDIHIQSTPSTTWSFDHGLNNKRPVITVYNINDEVIVPEKIFGSSSNTTYIYFPIPVAGYAAATVGSRLPSGSLDWTDILNKPTGIVSSSNQVNLIETNNSKFANITYLYSITPTSSTQSPNSSGSILVNWRPLASYNSDTEDTLISGSYFKITSTGSFLIECKIKITNPPSLMQVDFVEDILSGNDLNYTAIYSSSADSTNYLTVYHLYNTTSSLNTIGIRVIGDLSYSIPQYTGKTNSFFKVTKIKT